MRNALHGLYKKTAETILPPLSKSQFEEKRVLTPQEFVLAGDYLVRACPTWSWETGDASKARSYFPLEKQYLVTRGGGQQQRCCRQHQQACTSDPETAALPQQSSASPPASRSSQAAARRPGSVTRISINTQHASLLQQLAGCRCLPRAAVPCLSRASDIERYDPKSEFALGGEEDGWVATHQDPSADSRAAAAEAADIPDLDEPAAAAAGGAAAGRGGEEDEVPDISELELEEPDDEAALPAASSSAAAAGAGASGIKRTRTYDLYITYDQYYQVPRLWLVGFDEAKQPLTPEQVLEDVSEEHARKTITLDPHPNLAVSAASIHPCRHAETMKKLSDNLIASGTDFKLEQYLVLFLKFIASVVPTITYDYTFSVGGQ